MTRYKVYRLFNMKENHGLPPIKWAEFMAWEHAFDFAQEFSKVMDTHMVVLDTFDPPWWKFWSNGKAVFHAYRGKVDLEIKPRER